MYKSFRTERVVYQRLLLEYIKGPDNDVVGALSILPLISYDEAEIDITI